MGVKYVLNCGGARSFADGLLPLYGTCIICTGASCCGRQVAAFLSASSTGRIVQILSKLHKL